MSRVELSKGGSTTLAAAVALWLQATLAVAQISPSEQEIGAALDLGRAKKFLAQKLDGPKSNPWNGWARGPFMRIVEAARDAAEAKKPFTRADVTQEMIEPALTIQFAPTSPLWPDMRDAVMATMKKGFEVELFAGSQPKKGELSFLKPENAIKPTRFHTRIDSGVTVVHPVHGVSYWIWADFPAKDLPEGDLVVLVRCAAGEWNYFLSGTDRAKVR